MTLGKLETTVFQISVILCAYTEERWEYLLAAAESIKRQTLPPLELIIVIDHNPQLLVRTQEAIPWARVISNQGEPGTSPAKNTAIKLAQGTILAFMDEDAVAEPNWLSSLSACYTETNILGVGGKIEPIWQIGQPKWFPTEFNWVVGCSYQGLPTISQPVRNLIGCNMSIRKDVFQRVGLFNSDIGRIGKIPLGCEETELCIRATQQIPGGEFIYEPQAIVCHNVPATRVTWQYFLYRSYAEGLSKAQISELVGETSGLASERSYIFRTLPIGIIQGIRDTLLQHNLAGIKRSTAILIGLLYTTAGYIVGKVYRPLPQQIRQSFQTEQEKVG